MSRKPVGWRKHSVEHALARRGHKTRFKVRGIKEERKEEIERRRYIIESKVESEMYNEVKLDIDDTERLKKRLRQINRDIGIKPDELEDYDEEYPYWYISLDLDFEDGKPVVSLFSEEITHPDYWAGVPGDKVVLVVFLAPWEAELESSELMKRINDELRVLAIGESGFEDIWRDKIDEEVERSML